MIVGVLIGLLLTSKSPTVGVGIMLFTFIIWLGLPWWITVILIVIIAYRTGKKHIVSDSDKGR